MYVCIYISATVGAGRKLHLPPSLNIRFDSQTKKTNNPIQATDTATARNQSKSFLLALNFLLIRRYDEGKNPEYDENR